MTPQYSSNPQVQCTIAELLAQGCPPIPVAPKQLALENPKITGKNPSYLDPRGIVKFCKHRQFQDRLPTEEELRRFFGNPNTGVGTLGGHAGIVWLDFDRKCYPSQEGCDADFERIVDNICAHAESDRSDLWLERTGSGGYRIAVIPDSAPGFTNFATAPEGDHVGEALGAGRFTVLAPSIHPNGNPYVRLESGQPVRVVSLEAIGIYPATTTPGDSTNRPNRAARRRAQQAKRKSGKQKKSTRDITRLQRQLRSHIGVPLELLLTLADRAELNGAAEGSRNNTGYKLAINLIATMAAADRLGIPTIGDPRQLFDTYCRGCSPSIDPQEAELIWASASAANGTSSMPDDVLLICAIAYQIRTSPRTGYVTEPDPKAYAEYLAWELEQIRCMEAETRQDFFEGFKSLFDSIRAKACRLFRGFGTPPPHPTIARLEYVPGFLPTPEEWRELGCPKIIFQAGQRIIGFSEAIQKGWKLVLDKSAPGLGKSHEAGLLTIEELECDRIWLMSDSHRNPTTATQEANFTDMPVRDDGLVTDPTRQTAMGNPHTRWPKEGEQPNTGNNCHRAKIFHSLAEKGYQIDRTETADGGAPNVICETCPFCDVCAHQTGNGYGFRAERRAIFGTEEEPGATKVRLHPNSSPEPSESTTKEVSVWDEASKILEATSDIVASMEDFSKVWGDVEGNNPEGFDQLREVRLVLRSLLNGNIQQPHYGWNDAALRELLPDVPPDIIEIISDLADILNPNFQEMFTEADSVNMDGVDGSSRIRGDDRARLRQSLQAVRSMLRRENNRSSLQKALDLPSNWLIPFLEVWAGVRPGALRINHGKLTIVTREGRHQELVQAFKFNIFLDATTDPEQLAFKLGVDASEILWMEQETPEYSNLTIKYTGDFNQAGKQRSSSTDERIIFFIDALRDRHYAAAVFDHLAKADITKANGWWFNHTRSSNEFMRCEAIASFGIPYKNIGALEDEWLTITGRHPDETHFKRFTDWHTQSEIIQSVGRLRAHLRSCEQLTYYFCAEYPVEFLLDAFPGVKLEEFRVASMCPEAGTPHQQNGWRILQAIAHLASLGQKITQQAVSAISGVARSTISWLANGAWKILSKGLLIDYRDFDKFLAKLTPEERLDAEAIAHEVLPFFVEVCQHDPPSLLEEIQSIVKINGWRVVVTALRLTTEEVKVKILAAVMGVLPASLKIEFMEAAVGF